MVVAMGRHIPGLGLESVIPAHRRPHYIELAAGDAGGALGGWPFFERAWV